MSKKSRRNRRNNMNYDQRSNSNGGGFFLFITIAIVIVVGFLIFLGSSGSAPAEVNGASSEVTTLTGDEQIIEVTARGGYTPKTISAKANVPTILRMKSNNAFGCERAFSIPSLGITKTLPSNGNTDINLGTQIAGTKIKGTCSMGMYIFTINFN